MLMLGILLLPRISAALFDLSGHAGHVHWHFILLSWPNIIVVLLMIAVFWLAILLPFPDRPVIHRESQR